MDAMVTSTQQPSRGRFGGPLPLWGGARGSWSVWVHSRASSLCVPSPEALQGSPSQRWDRSCLPCSRKLGAAGRPVQADGPGLPTGAIWGSFLPHEPHFSTPSSPMALAPTVTILTTQAVHSPDQAEEQLRDPNSMKIHLSAVPASACPPTPRRLYRLYRGTSGGRGTPGLLRAQGCPGT